ncbi:cell cycle progression protein 1 isoform 3-T3 [Menidia menidia]
MSDTSSDAESSCGWTIISNEGSDIETLGSEAVVEFGAEALEPHTVEEPELLQSQASASAALSAEENAADILEDTLEEQTLDETLYAPGAGDRAAGKEHVLSSSDHSDIVTLGDLKEGEHVQEEPAVSEELYLGMSCSSHYTFTATDTGLLLSHWKLPQTLVNLSCHLRSRLTPRRSFKAVFPAQQPAVTNSSSSEDEAGRGAGAIVRRRRVRKNTTSVMTDPEEEEEPVPVSRLSEEEAKVREGEQQEEHTEVRPASAADDGGQGQFGSILNKCILLALVIALSMGFGHFYGTMQIQERQKNVEKIRVSELDVVRDLLERKQGFTEKLDFGEDSLDEQQIISLLAEVIETMKVENQELNNKWVHIQASEEKTNIRSEQQSLTAENQLLKSSLEHEEQSLAILQEELRKLRSQIRDLEAMGAGADSLLSENQRLKGQLDEDEETFRDFQVQRDDLVAEAQMLRRKLEKEKRVTEELRREMNRLRTRIPETGKEGYIETEELQSRLTELEKRLSFEQQRSDLWERLYLETKEERAKGDREPKVKKPKGGMAGKVKETFDAVKNSTKEFVSHHKEQIKKAKEAVKENLRKFSDSVKSTFRHFKDSASTFMDKARGFYNNRCTKKNTGESCQHRQHHRHKPEPFQSNHNTRKSGGKAHDHQGQSGRKSSTRGCAGVFDCAYKESMSLFNVAAEPIRADEFYQLLQSYLHQEVDHFEHWSELEMFINSFFHNGVFIHDQMLFTDFVSGVEDYLTDMHEYHIPGDDVFGDLDDYVFRHFFGETYSKSYGPRGPFERPDADSKEESRARHQQRKQQRARSRPHSERKWSRSGRDADRPMADVKIELGPMPFDPKY